MSNELICLYVQVEQIVKQKEAEERRSRRAEDRRQKSRRAEDRREEGKKSRGEE
jgi:hypothetical protein